MRSLFNLLREGNLKKPLEITKISDLEFLDSVAHVTFHSSFQV